MSRSWVSSKALRGATIEFGDLDNDGDQDVYITIAGMMEGDFARNALFENPGQGNHWITLRLEAERSNRAAIGARINVSLTTPRGPRNVYTTVSSGGSFGASSLQQEIGLGDATAIRALQITWPVTGKIDTIVDIAMDRVYRIREGDSAPVLVDARPFRLAPAR